MATSEQVVPLKRVESDDPKRAVASVRSFQRVAMQWAYIVRNRKRWSGREALVRDQSADALKVLKDHFALGDADLLALSRARVAQVSIPYRTEEEGWENRVLPWEFLLSAATRPMRQGRPITIMRQLVRAGVPPATPRTPKTVLYVESAPDQLSGEYDFESERSLVQTALTGLAWHEIKNPTRDSLRQKVAALSPDIIHLAGFDTHQGLRVLEGNAEEAGPDASTTRETTRPSRKDGYILAGTAGSIDSVDAQDLGGILCAGTRKPLLVTCNFWNSASRTCPLLLVEGAGASLGFQDSCDDESIESFLSAFYLHWRLAQWRLPDAFSAAWEKVRHRPAMIGTGIVLWTDRRLVGAETRAVEARTSKVQERINKASEQVHDPNKVGPLGDVITLAIKASDELNYSLLHNRRPLFETFKLVKKKPGTMESLTVTVDLNAGGQTFPYRRHFDFAESELDLRTDIHAPLTADLVRSLREAINTSLYVEVCWQTRVLYRDTHRVRLLPPDQWRDNDEDRKWLPCFVLPRDPAVGALIEKAHRYVRVLRDDPASGFDGYQSIDSSREDATEDVDLQVQAIWSAILHEWELGYVNPPPTYSRELDSQRLRTPSAIIADRSGTCIDLTLLMAACLELVDIYPVIFLLDGHAFPGYWRSADAHEEFLKARNGGSDAPADPGGTPVTGTDTESWISGRPVYDEIVRQVDEGHLVPLESVKLTENCGFWEAVEAGRENLRPKREFHSMVDVLSARFDNVTPLPIGESKL